MMHTQKTVDTIILKCVDNFFLNLVTKNWKVLRKDWKVLEKNWKVLTKNWKVLTKPCFLLQQHAIPYHIEMSPLTNDQGKISINPNKTKSSIWVEVFKNGPSKICGRQALKKLKWYGLLIHIIITCSDISLPKNSKYLFFRLPKIIFCE